MCIYIYTHIYIITFVLFFCSSYDAEDLDGKPALSPWQAAMRLLQEHFAATVAQCLCRWLLLKRSRVDLASI